LSGHRFHSIAKENIMIELLEWLMLIGIIVFFIHLYVEGNKY